MFDFIKNSGFFQAKKVMAITVNILPDGLQYDYVILEKKKDQINLVESAYQLSNVDELLIKVTAKIPLLISVQGKRILTKALSIQEEDADENIINRLLPNADVNEFYISKTSLGKDQLLVSVIRQNICDEITALFPQKNIVALSIGANQIVHLFDVLPDKETWIYNTYQWKKEQEQIKYSKATQKDINEWLKIGDERLHIDNTVSYANGLTFLISMDESFVEFDVYKNNKKELMFANLFMLLGWAILVIIFSVLLINFLMFDHYNKKNNTLSMKVEQNRYILAQMDTLEKQIDFKEEFVKNNSTGNTRFSFYADIIADLLPKNIVLISLDMQSLKKRLKKTQEALFVKNRILIKGFAKNSRTLNDWIKDLQKEDWIKDTEIINYNREAANLSGEFELGIDLMP